MAETSVLSPMLPFVALVAGLYYLHDTPSFQQVRLDGMMQRDTLEKQRRSAYILCYLHSVVVPLFLPPGFSNFHARILTHLVAFFHTPPIARPHMHRAC